VQQQTADDVWARIEALARERPGGVIATDGDGTLWSGDVGDDLFHAFLNHGRVEPPALEAFRRSARDHGLSDAGQGPEIARRIYAAYLAGAYPEDVMCEVMTWCFAGWTRDEVRAFSSDVIDRGGLAAASLVLLVAFVVREARARNPLIPLRIFRSRNVTGANLIQIMTVAGMFGMFFLGALYLQRVLPYSALEVGLAFLPTTVVMGALSLGFSEKLIMRFGSRTTLIPGVCLVVVALLLFARTPVDANYLTDLLPPFLLIAIGIGTSFPGIMTLAMSGATPEDAGLASGLVNTSMQVGGAVGLAVLATLSTERSENLIASGTAQASALTSGYHLAYLVGAGLAAIAVAIAVFVLRQEPMPAGAHAEEAGEREGRREPAYSESS